MTKKEIETRAAEVLHQHGLYSIPIDPVVLANRVGIKVHNAKFWVEGISGVVTKRGTMIQLLVNQEDTPARKRFTIAHELGHHFLHLLQDGVFVDKEVDLFRGGAGDGDVGPSKKEEVQANQFAAALLMPEEFVRREFEDVPDLTALARLFNVSDTAMGFRLSQLRLI
jgi:Zn-dependent peptidase ImmA (M78 family)